MMMMVVVMMNTTAALILAAFNYDLTSLTPVARPSLLSAAFPATACCCGVVSPLVHLLRPLGLWPAKAMEPGVEQV
jgi:hypothetical protein